ncbi:MAG: glyoxalase [Acidimicrobiia bacterium]|nr:glyoxalase [Acidimicrobiia bacterium]
MGTTFGHINIVVNDMDATIAFYRLLGLDLADGYEWPEGSGAIHVNAQMPGGHYLAFDNHKMAEIWNPHFDPDRNEGNIVVGLLVESGDDVDRIYRSVEEAGHRVGQAPYDAFFGARYAIVIDPDGNEVGLKGPIDEASKYIPSDST